MNTGQERTQHASFLQADRIGIGLRHLAVDHKEAAGPDCLGAHAHPRLPRIRHVCGPYSCRQPQCLHVATGAWALVAAETLLLDLPENVNAALVDYMAEAVLADKCESNAGLGTMSVR